MDIGVIGAGLSGLVAAKMLSEGGHSVRVYERQQSVGGRLASMKVGENNDILVDHREPCFAAHDPKFKKFVDELSEKGLLKVWDDHFPFFNGEEMETRYPAREDTDYYYAPAGMDQIGKYMSRWVDVASNERVGGFTFIGRDRHIKKPWMLNLTSADVYEVDAVIVATPAPQAYGLINSAQDETDVKKLITELEYIEYNSCFSIILTYKGAKQPDWKAIECTSAEVDWIINESSKRDTGDDLVVVIHSSHNYYTSHHGQKPQDTIKQLLNAAAKITGDWITKPDWTHIHNWKYRQPINPLAKPFLEIDRIDGTLALIGDYYNGKTIEAAYLSGCALAERWLERFPVK